MRARIAAVVAVYDEKTGKACAQVVLRADGTIEHFGDQSAAVDLLALLIRSAAPIDAAPEA